MQERLAKNIAALRLIRQHFIEPADEEEYRRLFSQMSPVRCIYWSAPGMPPQLGPRTAFDDMQLCFSLRAQQKIVKGRFQAGGIGYIFADEWPLFLSAYRKGPQQLSPPEQALLELLEREGPMNIGLMRELSGLRAKDITPPLHKLQAKFLVFEDQADNEGDRSWHLFRQVFPEAERGLCSREEAIAQLLVRFTRLNIWSDERMAVNYYRFAARDVKAAYAMLEREGRLLPLCGGWIVPGDEELLSDTLAPKPGIFALHRNDFLVKSLEHQLSGRYGGDGLEVLWYLLIDGEFQGAVLGRFHNGPYELEDVVLDLPLGEALCRRKQVLAAVERVSDPAVSPLRRYLGGTL